MTQITLCEGRPTFEGRANGEYLVIKFPESDNGMMLSRHDALALWSALKNPIFEGFEGQSANIISFHKTGDDGIESWKKKPINW